ncbi:hypothetical protein AVEN_18312-1 [Araneus ventricosus]|uniref:Uncharacterized protein n=1 Tax=Araneus ventricosus TaxID=182803 RepID=A0A4Y2EQ23_ARAVE|nr:hypothetical protein AVEN_18312-1 [Araneus ventricosus]
MIEILSDRLSECVTSCKLLASGIALGRRKMHTQRCRLICGLLVCDLDTKIVDPYQILNPFSLWKEYQNVYSVLFTIRVLFTQYFLHTKYVKKPRVEHSRCSIVAIDVFCSTFTSTPNHSNPQPICLGRWRQRWPSGKVSALGPEGSRLETQFH